ncbi:hypothetical protein FO519_006448 [Halicephalobus sp. NKZ332]|nr:hypothetical protein FO519_006448 [Halicephalobus sp. NKZ332]
MGIPKTSQKLVTDAAFKTPASCRDFFKNKNRSRPTDVDDVSYVRTLCWNVDGTALYSGSDRYVTTYTFDNASKVRFRANLSGHEDAVESVDASKSNPNLFVSCSADKTVRLWDARVSKHSESFETKDANLYIAYSPDDNYAIFVDKSDNINILDFRVGQVVESVSYKEETNEVIVHPNGQYIFVAMSGGKVEVLKMPNLEPVRTIRAHPPLSSCQSLCLSPNQKFLAVGATDACCSIWNLETLTCIRTLQRLDYPVRSISYSHCGNLLATGSEDHFIDVAWTETGENVASVALTTEAYCVAWHPRVYLLAYATAPDRESRDHRAAVRVYGYSL